MNEGDNSDDMQVNISDIDDDFKKDKEIYQENVDDVKEQNKMEENELDEAFAIQESNMLKDESSQDNEIINKEEQNNQHDNIEEKINNYLKKKRKQQRRRITRKEFIISNKQ